MAAGLLAALLLAQAPAPPAAGAAPAGPTVAASATVAPAAGPVTVTATAGRSAVGIGEPFALEVRASGPAGTTYTFVSELSDDTVDLRTPPDDPKSGPPAPGVHRYQAAVFSLNQAQIPPIPVRYRLPDGTVGEAATAPLDLKVASVLPKDPEQQKPADIRGPLPVSIGRAFWIALAALVVCLAALVAWLVRRRRRPAASQVVPEAALVPPDVEALRALDALAVSGLLASGEYRAYYIQLTAVAKRYLERRLGAPVLEMTTAETLALLRGHPSADDLLPTVRDVASAADRIKFARGEGLVAEAERHLGAVRQLVATLEERLTPRPPLAEGQAA
jgi:hypothetical protein